MYIHTCIHLSLSISLSLWAQIAAPKYPSGSAGVAGRPEGGDIYIIHNIYVYTHIISL